MTLPEFETRYKGKKPDYDDVHGAQCVDLIKLYCVEVLDSPPIKGDAHTYVNNPLPANFNYTWNSPWYIPSPGSIAIWNKNEGGGFGHVAIVLEAHLMSFVSLDLNWPKGASVARIRHSYKNVKGFLLPKLRTNSKQYNQLIDDLREIIDRYPKM